MKSIRATVDHNDRVELNFGYDRDLVDNLVKVVSGFSWDKVKRRWLGSLHALAALDFACRKRGDVMVVTSWPTVAAPPVVLSSAMELKSYQHWMAGVLSQRREFLVCWSPRVGKTTVIVHAGATAIATRIVDRVIVLSPASVSGEWDRQLHQAFPGMTFAELEGEPIRTEKREKDFEARVLKAQAAERLKMCEREEKLLKDRWAAVSKVAPSEAQLKAAHPPELQISARLAEVAVKMREQRAKETAAEDAMLEKVRGAHFACCQHDLVAVQREPLLELAARGPFALCVDEIQAFNDEKSPRARALVELAHHPNCRKVWATSGTPMRNRPEDLVVFYSAMGGIGGGKWGFLKRYAKAFKGEYGWETGGDDNLDELAARLSAISHRLRREDVNPGIPVIDRKVTLCPLSREEGLRYKALEGALGKKAMTGKHADASSALRALLGSVLNVKLHMALARVVECVTAGKKVLVGANFHESLKAFEALLVASYPGAKYHCAGGWLGVDKRAEVLRAWREDPGANPLLVNILSSGVGIDLSDADGTIVLEIPYVPSDALQFEARILDVHLGKRTSTPWVEYMLAAGTVDEDMALANLRKVAVIDAVVGEERESRGFARSIRESGVVQTVDLGLESKDESAVEAALEGLRRRLAGGEVQGEALSVGALVGAVNEAFDDEEEDENERAERAAERAADA